MHQRYGPLAIAAPITTLPDQLALPTPRRSPSRSDSAPGSRIGSGFSVFRATAAKEPARPPSLPHNHLPAALRTRWSRRHRSRRPGPGRRRPRPAGRAELRAGGVGVLLRRGPPRGWHTRTRAARSFVHASAALRRGRSTWRPGTWRALPVPGPTEGTHRHPAPPVFARSTEELRGRRPRAPAGCDPRPGGRALPQVATRALRPAPRPLAAEADPPKARPKTQAERRNKTVK